MNTTATTTHTEDKQTTHDIGTVITKLIFPDFQTLSISSPQQGDKGGKLCDSISYLKPFQ